MRGWRLRWLAPIGLLLAVACGGSQASSPEADGPVVSGAWENTAQTLAGGWRTNFAKASISPDSISRAADKDAIPSLTDPLLVAVAEADFLAGVEPVLALESDGVAHAYPLQILRSHEVVNDTLAGRPLLISYCPLCNSAIVFDRVVDGRVLEFGVSGFLSNSDLIMFDRDTESWWQQLTGEAIVGDHTGERLEILPSSIVAWADFKTAFPSGLVLSNETGFAYDYGLNPYYRYDEIDSAPTHAIGPWDPRLPAKERVVAVELDGESVAYAFSALEETPVVADEIAGTEIVVFFKAGTASALDGKSIEDSRDVGAAAAFLPFVDGMRLSFRVAGELFVDDQTGSRWDILGRAVSGSLQGSSLQPVVNGSHFWFAWAAFHPETRVWPPAQ